MSGIQPNITSHTKNQKNKTHMTKFKPNQPEHMQMIEIVDKDIKTDIITVLHMF